MQIHTHTQIQQIKNTYRIYRKIVKLSEFNNKQKKMCKKTVKVWEIYIFSFVNLNKKEISWKYLNLIHKKKNKIVSLRGWTKENDRTNRTKRKKKKQERQQQNTFFFHSKRFTTSIQLTHSHLPYLSFTAYS